MKPHTKLYLAEMGYDESDWIPCEIPGCESRCIDVHHIERRGMGGTKQPEQIENLMGLCRWHHEKYGDIKQFKPFLNQVHHDYIIQRRGH